MQKQGTIQFKLSPELEKYFWDHTRNASDLFKLKRLLEYATFPDLLIIPFEFVKKSIREIDAVKLRTSETRKRFVMEIQKHIQTNSNWDDTILEIAGVA